MAPALCGSFLTDKRSLVAFTWTLTVFMTLLAFIGATVAVIHVHTRYIRLERYYEEQWEYQRQQQNNAQEEQEQQHGASQDREYERYLSLTSMQSGSLTFAAVYTVILATALALFGSTAVVGFTSLRGVFIAPCFSTSPGSSALRLGIFGGAVIFFANLLLVGAVVLGEVRVDDGREEQNREGEHEDRVPYEVERIATVLAVTCMFLAALYSTFAILLFLYFGSKESHEFEEDDVTKPSLSLRIDPRRENFITIGESS